MFGIFKKKQKIEFAPPVVDEQLGEEHAPTFMFDDAIEQITKLSPKAQATFLYRLVGKLPAGTAKTLHTYTSKRLGYDQRGNTRQNNDSVDRGYQNRSKPGSNA